MCLIVCLHTAASNVAVFEEAVLSGGLEGVGLRHVVRADLLAAAELAGGLTPAIVAETGAALVGLCAGADAVLLTCSTLGPAAAVAAVGAAVPIVRVDAALAEEALADEVVREGGTVVVLCAVETTVGPTRELFEAAARGTGAVVRVAVVEGAWAAFRAGDRALYLNLIAAAAEAALRGGAVRVALAQASMAGACSLVCEPGRVLGSPVAGLRAAVAGCAGDAAGLHNLA